MKFEIKGSDFPLTAALLTHTERRLRTGLARDGDRIKRVVVRIGDNNGPRGGEDKYCRVHIDLKNGQPVFVEDVGADLYSVISRVTARASHSVSKRMERIRRPRRTARPRSEFMSPLEAISQAELSAEGA